MSGNNVRLEIALLEKILDKPVSIIYNIICSLGHVRLAQLDRAFGYGPKGREFESSNARI